MNIDEDLQRLPTHDISTGAATRIRARSLAALHDNLRRLTPLERVAEWYGARLEPALALGVGVTYVVWSLRATVLLFH